MNTDQPLKLFPLNKVLFPGMPLYLNIFEERYKQMINECIETDAPFGVILIKNGTEAGGPLAQTFETGCAAKIAFFEYQDDGRIRLIAFGTEKFTVTQFSQKKDYLTAHVHFEMPIQSEYKTIEKYDHKLRDLLKKYMTLLADLQKIEFFPIDFPEDPVQMTYFIANILSVPLTTKQNLLNLTKFEQLIAKVTDLFDDECRILKMKFDSINNANMGPFFLN